MNISFTQVLIWIVIAALVGVVGELLAHRRAPDGIVGAILVGLFAIFLIVGVFHFRITGEPVLGGKPSQMSLDEYVQYPLREEAVQHVVVRSEIVGENASFEPHSDQKTAKAV
jgi:uncharacterized membrane protein YeaQ/YmgE (transglycosylase-associated protein family)